ncbi:MAG: hypothetical protein K0Q95_3310 [Bacteroidota bacterium]|jgi:hypothetical protein|nr:hypothetical protein [Bacteroidota bacterium]
MFKSIGSILLVLTSLSGIGQEVNATAKALNKGVPGKDLIIEISVTKPSVDGFMKYFQELPAGYSAEVLDCKGCDFKYADNGAKAIWVTPPSADQFVMTYKIIVPSEAKTPLSIGGKFSYVVGNERKIFEISPQVIDFGQTAPSTKTPESEPVKETVAEQKSEPVKTEPVAEQKPLVAEKKEVPAEKPKPAEVKKETPVITTPVNKAPVSAAASATAGKTYRVQIGAFQQKPQITGVSQLTTVLLDNGMTKYFSGNFKTYEEAKKRKEELKGKGFPGAFIVSFENGKIVK